jgi:hypothetical protein
LAPVYTHEQFKNYWLQGRIDLGELLGKKLKPVVKVKMERRDLPAYAE